MNPRKNKISKAFSWVVVVGLFFQNLAFAGLDAPSVTTNLNKQFSEALFIPESVARVEDSFKADSGSWIVDGKSKNPSSTIHHPPSMIYLIQDAHTNESGQLNLAKTLDILLSKNKNIQYVFTEAGDGDDSLSYLRSLANLEKRKRVALSFLKKGLLNGAEYLDLTSDHLFTIWGVEDKTLYEESLKAYRFNKKNREDFELYLAEIESTIKTLKPRLLNPSLLELDSLHEKFLKEDISLTDYIEKLTEAEAGRRKPEGKANTTPSALRPPPSAFFPHLTALKSLKSLESTIDFPKAQEEQQKAILSLSKEDQQELLEYKSGRTQSAPTLISSNDHKAEQAFFLLLEEKLMKDGGSWMVDGGKNKQPTTHNPSSTIQYPNLSVYFHYLRQAKALNPQEILKEQKALETEVLASLTTTKDEETLLKCQTKLRLLKKLFNLTLTPEEYKEHKDSGSWIVDNKNPNPPSTIHHPPSSFTITHLTGFLNKKIMDLEDFYERAVFLRDDFEEMRSQSEKFYELTERRDEKFVENMLEKMDDGWWMVDGGENKKSTIHNPLATIHQNSSAILITGGFHIPNLKKLLEEQGISYVVLAPQVLQETNKKKYEKILLSQRFTQGNKEKVPPSPPFQLSPYYLSNTMKVFNIDERPSDFLELGRALGLNQNALAAARLSRPSEDLSPDGKIRRKLLQLALGIPLVNALEAFSNPRKLQADDKEGNGNALIEQAPDGGFQVKFKGVTLSPNDLAGMVLEGNQISSLLTPENLKAIDTNLKDQGKGLLNVITQGFGAKTIRVTSLPIPPRGKDAVNPALVQQRNTEIENTKRILARAFELTKDSRGIGLTVSVDIPSSLEDEEIVSLIQTYGKELWLLFFFLNPGPKQNQSSNLEQRYALLKSKGATIRKAMLDLPARRPLFLLNHDLVSKEAAVLKNLNFKETFDGIGVLFEDTPAPDTLKRIFLLSKDMNLPFLAAEMTKTLKEKDDGQASNDIRKSLEALDQKRLPTNVGVYVRGLTPFDKSASPKGLLGTLIETQGLYFNLFGNKAKAGFESPEKPKGRVEIKGRMPLWGRQIEEPRVDKRGKITQVPIFYTSVGLVHGPFDLTGAKNLIATFPAEFVGTEILVELHPEGSLGNSEAWIQARRTARILKAKVDGKDVGQIILPLKSSFGKPFSKIRQFNFWSGEELPENTKQKVQPQNKRAGPVLKLEAEFEGGRLAVIYSFPVSSEKFETFADRLGEGRRLSPGGQTLALGDGEAVQTFTVFPGNEVVGDRGLQSQTKQNTLSQRSLEYTSTRTFLTVEGLRTKVTDPKGFVEIPVSKVGQALESKAEFDSFLSFLKLYLGVRKYHHYYLEIAYLSEDRQNEVKALVEELGRQRVGTLSTERPKEGIISRLNFINELNASIPLDFDSQRELLVHVEADFSVGTLPNLIAGLGEAEEAANLYSSYSPNSILPKVEEEEALLQDLAHSQALKIREEFKAQKTFRLNAQILDDLYRGRIKKPETIKASALRSVLKLVDDQVEAFRMMMAAARFA